MKTIIETSDLLILRDTPIFQGLSNEDLKQIAPHFEKKIFAKNEPIFLAQDVCEYVWIIKKGLVEITSYDSLTKSSHHIATLKQGQQFAEVAALTSSRHSAGAYALEPTELLAIRADAFKEILSQNLFLAQNMVKWLTLLAQNSIQKRNSIDPFNENDLQPLDSYVTRLLPFEFLTQYNVLPIELSGQRLTMASVEPLKADIYNYIHKVAPELEIKPTIINNEQFKIQKQVLSKFYTATQTQPTLNIKSLQTTSANPEELLHFSILFSQLTNSIHKRLIPTLHEVHFNKGDIISTPGSKEARAFLISQGTIEVFKHVTPLKIYQELISHSTNDVVFDFSIFNNKKLPIGMFAKTDVHAFEFNASNIIELMKSKDFSLPLCFYLAHYIRELNQYKNGYEILDASDMLTAESSPIKLDQEIQRQFDFIILNTDHQDMFIGTPKLLSEEALDALRKNIPGYRFKEKLISKVQLDELRISRDNPIPPNEMITQQKNIHPVVDSLKIGTDDAVNLLDRIIREAVQSRASDVHIEARENVVIIRYRIDGSLTCLWEDIPKTIGTDVIRRSKMLAKMDTAESRLPQDGRFQLHDGSLEVELRVSVVPTRHGEKVVMRIIGKRGEVISLKQLASDRRTAAFLQRVVKHRQGIFLVSGPTGSGKSTTLYSALSQINALDVNIVTIEDPIEVNASGINQIEVNSAIGLLPAVLLRHVLRQDPDVIMIGEIRDMESMKLALEASMTGHLVLSTIHSNSALEVLPRLKELGADNSSIAGNLIGVLAQRLVRSLCRHCKTSRPLTVAEQKRLSSVFSELDAFTQTMQPVGCIKCHYSGFLGQIPIFEFWERTAQIRQTLLDNNNTESFVAAVRASGFKNLEQYGLRMVANGLTTFAELDSVVYGLSWDDESEIKNQDNKPKAS
jgi:type II secretory ATPase GspE/PulE/Tfp pilus assembly ATPase PilB-like protein